MEPSPDELSAFGTSNDVYRWAGVGDPLIRAIHEEVGALSLIRELAGLDELDITEAYGNIMLPHPSNADEFVKLKPLDKTRLKLARSAARLRVGLPADGAQPSVGLAPSPTVGPPTLTSQPVASGSSSGIELGSVWDQASRTPVVLLGTAEGTRLYKNS